MYPLFIAQWQHSAFLGMLRKSVDLIASVSTDIHWWNTCKNSFQALSHQVKHKTSCFYLATRRRVTITLPNGTVKMYKILSLPLKDAVMNKSLFPPPTYSGSFRGKQAEIKELAHIQHVWLHTVNNNQHFGCFHGVAGEVPATLLIFV